jgi:hypothetical protein
MDDVDGWFKFTDVPVQLKVAFPAFQNPEVSAGRSIFAIIVLAEYR